MCSVTSIAPNLATRTLIGNDGQPNTQESMNRIDISAFKAADLSTTKRCMAGHYQHRWVSQRLLFASVTKGLTSCQTNVNTIDE